MFTYDVLLYYMSSMPFTYQVMDEEQGSALQIATDAGSVQGTVTDRNWMNYLPVPSLKRN